MKRFPDIKADNYNSRKGEFSAVSDEKFKKNLKRLQKITFYYKPKNVEELQKMMFESNVKFFVSGSNNIND